MNRRHFLSTAAVAALGILPRPGLAQSAGSRVLNFVPAAALTALDPIWTTAAVTRAHGYLVYDSLYGMDGSLQPHPQMAEGALFEDEGRLCTITLREGLRFHDGEPVLARDCVASLARWMKRSPLGQKLESTTEELAALDDRRLRFRLRRPFPLLLNALASVGPQAAIMPERLARTSAFEQVREVVGSGPYRFLAGEYVSGSRAVYARNTDYRPAGTGQGLTAGPKVTHFDRIVWNMIPDQATSAAALQAGEVDWVEQPSPDFVPIMRRDGRLKVEKIDLFPQVGVLRFNHLNDPTSNQAFRQALLPAIQQSDYAIAVVGEDRDLWVEDVGMFTPGTESASKAGLEPLQGPRSIDRTKELLRAAGYHGQTVRLLAGSDLASVKALGDVAADMLQRAGLNLDLVMTDWGTVVQRRASREPLEKGGWSMYCTHASWFEFADPAVNGNLRGNGLQASQVGWPTMPTVEAMREEWFVAPDAPTRRAIAERIQAEAMRELPYIPLGAFHFATAMRANITDRITGLPLFWNIRRV